MARKYGKHKLGGGGGHTSGGTDHYKHHATETSVDYKAGMPHEKPGAAGPSKARATAGSGHAPVPGYSHTNITTSCDYPSSMGAQKPGTCGPTLGSGRRKHY